MDSTIKGLNGWEDVKICPLCGSDKNTGYIRGVSANPIIFIQASDAFDLMVNTPVHYQTCAVCGLQYQSPRLDSHALSVYYSSGFYRQTNSGTDEQSDAGEEARAKVLVEFLSGRYFSSVLDIGCSRAYFLSMTNIQHKFGVEIDRRRPFQVDDSLIYSEIPEAHFDLITTVHYLEHDPQPMQLLKRLDCNYLYLEVPSEESLGGPARLPHLTIWSLPTLLYAAEPLGYKAIKYRHSPHHCLLLEKA